MVMVLMTAKRRKGKQQGGEADGGRRGMIVAWQTGRQSSRQANGTSWRTGNKAAL